MDDQQLERLEKLEKQKRKQLDRQNKYINANYDRIGLALPKGQKTLIESRAKEKGYKSITEYIKALIDQDLATASASDQGQSESPGFTTHYHGFLPPEEDGGDLPFTL